MNKMLVALGMLLWITGCYWDNVATLIPEGQSCDTLDVSFASDVIPILSNNCYGCHSNANAPDFGNGLSLEDYADVTTMSARIIGAINHDNGFVPMPQGSQKLDSCKIGKIEAWVNQGSLNN